MEVQEGSGQAKNGRRHVVEGPISSYTEADLIWFAGGL